LKLIEAQGGAEEREEYPPEMWRGLRLESLIDTCRHCRDARTRKRSS
jgi:hypothetical protein